MNLAIPMAGEKYAELAGACLRGKSQRITFGNLKLLARPHPPPDSHACRH